MKFKKKKICMYQICKKKEDKNNLQMMNLFK